MVVWECDFERLLDVFVRGVESVCDVYRFLTFPDVHRLGEFAHFVRLCIVGNVSTFVVNVILNYTDVCVVRCKFCAFWRDRSRGFVLSPVDAGRIVKYIDVVYGPVRQVLVQGGINPEIGIEYIEDLFKMIKHYCPHVSIHGLSPLEVHYLAIRERMSYREVFERLKAVGLESMPGGGGEILVNNVRRVVSPCKIDSDTWIRVMEEAHRMGIPTSATMMYGHIENIWEQAEHIYKILRLQKKTRGFNSFIAWSFEPGNTELSKNIGIKYPVGPINLLRIVATARLVFRELIPHIQASWLTNGIEVAQLALKYGADDFGGTLYNEKVIPSTGLKMKILRREDIINIIRSIGQVPAERDNFYRIIKVYN